MGASPLASGEFEAVVLKDLLEHVGDPVTMVREAYRLLKPGGRVFASSPDAERWVWDDYTHRRPFTRKGFRKLFADTRFAVEQLGYESVMPGIGWSPAGPGASAAPGAAALPGYRSCAATSGSSPQRPA